MPSVEHGALALSAHLDMPREACAGRQLAAAGLAHVQRAGGVARGLAARRRRGLEAAFAAAEDYAARVRGGGDGRRPGVGHEQCSGVRCAGGAGDRNEWKGGHAAGGRREGRRRRVHARGRGRGRGRGPVMRRPRQVHHEFWCERARAGGPRNRFSTCEQAYRSRWLVRAADPTSAQPAAWRATAGRRR